MDQLLAGATWDTVMPLAWRGLGTLAVVAAALLLLRRGGQAMAGLVAAIPVTSAPALAWVGVDRGAAFAADASLAALYATGLTAVYAAAYATLARRFGRIASLAAAAGLTVLLCAATRGFAVHAVAVVVFTLACFAGAFAALPVVQAAPARTGASARDVAFTAGVSGALTIVVSMVARDAPPQWCGLIAAIPVVGMTTILVVHGRWPLANLRAFLRAYAHGLIAKACFVATLAATLVPLGLIAGWVAALAAAAAALAARSLAGGPHRLPPVVALRAAQGVK